MTPMGVLVITNGFCQEFQTVLIFLIHLVMRDGTSVFGCQLANERGRRWASISSTSDPLQVLFLSLFLFCFSWSQLLLLLLVFLVGLPINIPHKKCAIIKTCGSLCFDLDLSYSLDWSTGLLATSAIRVKMRHAQARSSKHILTRLARAWLG